MSLPAASERPGRLAVGVVGTGRVGSVLAAALARAGHTVVAATAVSAQSRRRAAALLPGVPLVEPPQALPRADLVLLAVPDDALPALAGGLARAGTLRAGTFVAHPSGRYGVAVLDPLRQVGALPLALHPAMTFTGTEVDLARLAGTSFGVTAQDALRPVAETLVLEMGGEPVWVPEPARVLYHAALCFGANYLTTLVTQAGDLLARAGVEAPPRLLAPLLGAALDNALRWGDRSLTGPVARGDRDTILAHVGELERVAPEARAAYLALARLTADRAVAAGVLDRARAAGLLDVLAGG